MRSSIVWGNVLDDFFKLCVYHGYDDCRLVDSHLPGNQLSSFSWRQTGGIDFSEFLQSLVFFFGCSGTHEKLIKTGTLRKLGKWAPKLSRPTHPAVSVVFFLLPEPCRAKQAKQGVLGWVEANPVISGGWITQNCWKNMFYYWKYWKWPSG